MAAQESHEPAFTADELKPVREILLRRRHELVEQLAAHAGEMSEEQDSEPATEEEEAAARQHTQFVSARMLEGFHREILAIDAAMRRMDAGLYGRCEDCDEPIAIERLKVLPYTRLCAVDAAVEERNKTLHSPGRSLSL